MNVTVQNLDSAFAEMSRKAVEQAQVDRDLRKNLSGCMQMWSLDLKQAKEQFKSIVKPLSAAGHSDVVAQIEQSVASAVYRKLCSGVALKDLDLRDTCS